jgi:hypothetical protein
MNALPAGLAVVEEFALELSGNGPKIHFIVREPNGIRIEFAFDPRARRPDQGATSRRWSGYSTSVTILGGHSN